jgi:hypothetical protein
MRLLLLTVLLFGVASLHAQPREVAGRVLDAESGAGIAGATVQVEGTRRATVTNDEGAFVLPVDRLPATLVVRRIAYRTARPRVTGTGAVEVRLERAELELAAFDVTGEDPAVRLMRRVIEARGRRRAALAAYHADAYTRYVVRNDTGIVAIAESESDVFWRREGGLREVVRARRQTANLPLRGVLPAADDVLDLSAEEIEVAGFRFIGLTNARALDTYRFRITGQRALDGQRVYDLDVAPRDPLSVAFSGTIAVLDSVAAIVEADLRPGPAFRFPPPINRYETRLRQTFGAFDDTWLPASYRADTHVEVGMGAALRFPAFRIEQVSRLSDYRIGEAGPDSLFARRRVAVADSAAATRTPARGVPLTLEEQAAYASVDSSDTIQKAFRPRGPLARFIRINMRAGEDTVASTGGGRGAALSFTPRLWVNRVEGVHVGLRVGAGPARARLTLEGGYETQTERIAYDGRLALGRARGRVEVAYGEATVPIAPSYLQTRAINGVAMLLGGGDLFDYTRRQRAELRLSTERMRPLRGIALAVRAEHHTAPVAAATFALRGEADARPNAAFPGTDLRSVTVEARLGRVPALGIVGGDALTATLEQGVRMAGGDAAFTRLAVTADVQVPTLARRRPFPATLDVRFVGQALAGDDVRVRWGLVEPARHLATPFGSLRTRRTRAGTAPPTGPAFAAVFAEHNFRTLLWERLGWDWPSRKGYSLLLTGAAAAVADAPLSQTPGWTGHLEAGASLSGLFGLLRLDLTARLDRPGFTVGIAPARLF